MDLDVLNGALNIVIAVSCGVLALVSGVHLLVYRRAMTAWDRTCTYALFAFFALAAADRLVGAIFRVASIYVLNPSYGGVYPLPVYFQAGLRGLMALVLWGLIAYAVTHRKEK